MVLAPEKTSCAIDGDGGVEREEKDDDQDLADLCVGSAKKSGALLAAAP